jgi:long-chain acyl-CoA synthetase
MVSGDKRPYLVGVLVPEAEWLDAWAKAHDKEGTSLAQLGNDPALHSALRAAVDRVNAELSVTEKVRQFIIADEPFSIEKPDAHALDQDPPPHDPRRVSGATGRVV